uniref:Large ribosomal subunit protein bL25 n=1 Tax=Candidatus Aschnera chinzeii TaxID=1485666 RepID=A0AAT9G4H7_9ENTR|nr:MAG: hypothetical protein ACHINZ_2870 [Candidatus Aschnera chinzeii]
MLKFNAKVRKLLGKSANRRLRNSNELPGIIYGKNYIPIHIKLNYNEISIKQKELEFYNDLVVVIDNKEIKVKIKDIQHHPYKLKIMHIDFIII